ncbi:MAG: hypothetical protein ACI9UJ_002060 [bacterium]|jgi:hypothetical protein
MKYSLKFLPVLFFPILALSSAAKESVTQTNQGKKTATSTANRHMKFAADCDPASAQADLDINNVRTRILNGGDMWWDLSNARY